MKTVRRTGLVAQVVDGFEDEIVSGRWAVGSRIPPEPVLAEMVGVGRNTVREAVQVLAHSGMLERRQGSGTYVLSPRRCVPVTTTGPSAVPPEDVQELKRLLVSSACMAVAVRGDAEDIESIRKKHIEWAASAETAYSDPDAVDILSRTIIVSTRNRAAEKLFDALPYISDRKLWNTNGDIERAFRGMLKALFSGDRIGVALEGASLTVRIATPGPHPADRPWLR